MKRLLDCILIIFLIPALTGAAVKAPVHVTRGFYVNDYASLLFDSHRDDMFRLSTTLYEQTGVQIVLLTVESLGEMELDEYVDAVVRGWGIGGEKNRNGALIFACTGSNASVIYVGEALPYLNEFREMSIDLTQGGNPSKSIMNIYRPMVERVYEQTGVTPDEETVRMLENPTVETKLFRSGTVIFLAMLALILARSFRVSRKYRNKYLKSYVRQRKDYTRAYNEEDEYNNEKIYRIDYDDRD